MLLVSVSSVFYFFLRLLRTQMARIGRFCTDIFVYFAFIRIQRFMSGFNFSMEIVARLIFKLLLNQDKRTLIIDRTNWEFGKSTINIFMLGTSYKNVAFSLMFKMLDKRGNLSCEERIELIRKYIDYFRIESIDCI